LPTEVHLIKAAFLKVLAHPVRLRILELLSQEEQTVGQVTELLKADQPTVSRHLAILRQGGLVTMRQEGLSVFYRIQNDEITRFLAKLTELLKSKLQIDAELLRSVKDES
jgi:DNA-binding transcriptional ArsR family regulator